MIRASKKENSLQLSAFLRSACSLGTLVVACACGDNVEFLNSRVEERDVFAQSDDTLLEGVEESNGDVGQESNESSQEESPGDNEQVLEPSCDGCDVWTTAASMNIARRNFSATTLNDGRVLVVGGEGDSALSAEIYNPESDTWSFTSAPTYPRTLHSATKLKDGRVLIVGGIRFGAQGGEGVVESEIFEPESETWVEVRDVSLGRYGHSASLRSDGSVVLAGGMQTFEQEGFFTPGPCESFEIYNPATDRFSSGPQHINGRTYHGVALTSDDSVIIMGGAAGRDEWRSVEIFGSNNTLELGPELPVDRIAPTTLVLEDGGVVLMGGQSSSGNPYSNAYRLTQNNGTWRWTSFGGDLSQGRADMRSASAGNGDTLIVGGSREANSMATVDRFNSATGTLSSYVSMREARSEHQALTLLDGRVMVMGGTLKTTDVDGNQRRETLASSEWIRVGTSQD